MSPTTHKPFMFEDTVSQSPTSDEVYMVRQHRLQAEEDLKRAAFLAEQREVLEGVLLRIFGTQCWDDSVQETSRRVIKSWDEFTPPSEPNFSFTTFDSKGTDQMILVKDIDFASLCAHHLFPFKGVCHIAYIPNKLQAGLSKFPRLVRYLAKRPSVQETLTTAIADHLEEYLNPRGLGVIIESQHTCMSCRGVEAREASMTTSKLTGQLLRNASARDEFLYLVGRGK